MDMIDGENKIEMCSNHCEYIRNFPSYGFLLLEQLNMQRYYGSFCDITVRIDDVDYRAHRCILSASSAKLQSLIFSIRQEWNNVLVIKEVTPASFQVVLDFIYTGSVRLVSTSVHDVLETARYLEMPDIEKVCLSYIEYIHSEERNVNANIRLMPELAPIAEVQLDGQMSTALSKNTDAGTFDATTHGCDKSGTVRSPGLHNFYNSKPTFPFLPTTATSCITIDTIEDYLKLMDTRQSSLTARQNWSQVFEMRNTDSEDVLHRTLPNLVRIDNACSSHLPDEDRALLRSGDNHVGKFSAYNLGKPISDRNETVIGRETATMAPCEKIFGYNSAYSDTDACTSVLKISPLPSLTDSENCDNSKTNLQSLETGSLCIPLNNQKGVDNFSQTRCEDIKAQRTIIGSDTTHLKLTSVDSIKRNRKKAPKKVRAAEVSSSDESNFASDAHTTTAVTLDAHNVSTFPPAAQDTSAFAQKSQETAAFSVDSQDDTNCVVPLDIADNLDSVASSRNQESDNKQSLLKLKCTGGNRLGAGGAKSNGMEMQDVGIPNRPLKKRIKVGQKRETKDALLLSCSLCNKKFGRTSELTRHQRSHTTQLYRCCYCSSEFTNPVLYKRHFICMHGERNAFFCVYPSCKFRSDRLSNIEKHAMIHTDIKLFVCMHCGKSFSQDNGLRSHLLSCTQSQSYLCDICGTKFNHLQSMRSHRRVHTGEKPYRCTDCGSQFADHRNFKRHRRIHENIFPYPCLLCDKRFRHSNSLKAHMSIHELCQNSK